MILSRAQLTLTTIPEVVSVTRYYMLRDQSLPAPAAPTTNPPTGWVTTEPEYAEGSTNNLYTVDLLLYSDDSFQYSLVSLSSAYAASKQAYILAKENEKHFFFDADGAHITHGEHTPNTGKNVLITNEGMAIRNDTTNLASFGAELLRMGPEESARVDIQPNATTFYGATGAQVGKIANATTYYSISGESIFEEGGDRESVISDYSNTTQTHTLSYTPVKNPNVSDAMLRVQFILENEGGAVYNQSVNFNEAGNASFETLPAAVTYSGRSVSVALGDLSTVVASSWEGAFIILRAYYYRSEDSSNYSLGMSSSATGKFSYAGGYGTTAAADYSHAHGRGLYTANSDITVVGRYNRYADAWEDSTLFAVGDGSSASARSDAFQVHSGGTIWSSRGWLPTYRDVFGVPYNTIGKNINLNTVVNPGNYYCAGGDIAATQTNQPFSTLSYQMLVFAFGGNQRLQIAWQNSTSTTIKYRFRNSNSEWGSWYVISAGWDNSQIGSVIWSNKASSGTTAIPAGSTYTSLTSITTDSGGTWLVNAHANFQNSSGAPGTYKNVAIGTTSSNAAYGSCQIPTTATGNTLIMTSRIVQLTGATTLYLNVFSAVACNVSNQGCLIEAVRLSM